MHECMMRTLILWSLTLSVEALASLSVPATTIQDSWTRARSVHEQECGRGFQLFGRTTTTTTTDHPPRNRVWSDDDFLSYAVGKENAGPDGSTLENGDIIFQSKEPLLSPDECQALIDEARQVIADGLANGMRGRTTSQPTVNWGKPNYRPCQKQVSG
jgi:hypothetical protein